MIWLLILFLIIVYIGCMATYISIITVESYDMTTKDAWMSLIWPILLIYSFVLHIIWIVNEALIFPCILVGFKYKDTNIYKKLNDII